LFALTGALVYFCWSRETWLGFAAALWVHGTVGSFLVGVAPHELGHGTVFRTKWANKGFLYLISLLTWWDPFDYASSHTYHHRYTQYSDGDRENLMPLSPALPLKALVQLFTVNLFSKPGRPFGKGGLLSTIFVTLKSSIGIIGSTQIPSREWLQALHDDQPGEARNSMWWSRLLLLFHGSVVAVSMLTGFWVIPLLVTFFPFVGNWGVFSVGFTQHCGLREQAPDFRKNTRSIKVNWLTEFLYWRMNWHIEHHMYAGVPCYNLRKLARVIAEDMPEPRTMVGAWREMLETWRRQQDDPSYEFDTPLPATAGDTPKVKSDDELESSIGELAPEGLR
jgi:fatty acid desaturase